ncbi:hypothetical protein RIF29_19109 [Crotalaria pallida]|uniref:Uncharacterized protein n=1 Tax=Crotalaria pallida TaxID=3830 RepID=A0AAN9F174_CROPI
MASYTALLMCFMFVLAATCSARSIPTGNDEGISETLNNTPRDEPIYLPDDNSVLDYSPVKPVPELPPVSAGPICSEPDLNICSPPFLVPPMKTPPTSS